ncbi:PLASMODESMATA CALLOSE-BINDING PROTEIN 3-like [Salvia divinorum]|uniref:PLASMODESMATA CALLOSE-BINDING PROTEIN 3-like n=1 Tax=Salvia divinorum TaxID=28513 RepID=A0ABD1G8G5_SALDI
MMSAFVFSFVIFSALAQLAASSDATFCLCNSGLSDTELQKTIDYACRNGAHCSPILQTGKCYNPNTLQDHCNYVVNSLYQKKSHLGTTCDFQGAAALSQNVTNAMLGACVYQATPSKDGGTTTTPGRGQATTIPGGSLVPTPAGAKPPPSLVGALARRLVPPLRGPSHHHPWWEPWPAGPYGIYRRQ